VQAAAQVQVQGRLLFEFFQPSQAAPGKHKLQLPHIDRELPGGAVV